MHYFFKKSPLQLLDVLEFGGNKYTIWVKRDDLIHPEVQGNKWRKLKYNLEYARQHGYTHLLTFGGAFSNHLYAVAAAGRLFGFETQAIVRGEAVVPLNPSLQFAIDSGMSLHFVSRSEYRILASKSMVEIFSCINFSNSNTYILPEGGTNGLALVGCQEIIGEVTEQLGFSPDYYTLAVGTGGTIAGLIAGLSNNITSEVVGYGVLKGDFLKNTVVKLLSTHGVESKSKWRVENQYHFGGYAKTKPELWTFKQWFETKYGFELDVVYTAKMFYGLFTDIAQGKFAPNTHIVAIHTGGLQGNHGFESRFGLLVPNGTTIVREKS